MSLIKPHTWHMPHHPRNFTFLVLRIWNPAFFRSAAGAKRNRWNHSISANMPMVYPTQCLPSTHRCMNISRTPCATLEAICDSMTSSHFFLRKELKRRKKHLESKYNHFYRIPEPNVLTGQSLTDPLHVAPMSHPLPLGSCAIAMSKADCLSWAVPILSISMDLYGSLWLCNAEFCPSLASVPGPLWSAWTVKKAEHSGFSLP